LSDRKRILSELLADVGPPIVYSDHMVADGQAMFDHACRMGLEGVISKRSSAPYRSGRGESWIKVKCVTRGTFTVVGYSPEGKGLVAALYLARKDGRNFTFVGKVGTGWSMKQSAEIRASLDALAVEMPALAVPGRFPKARWVRPTLRADVEYRAITAAGLLRHSVWKGAK
jgi:bifunctional non-homologous end joining protein LigD